MHEHRHTLKTTLEAGVQKKLGHSYSYLPAVFFPSLWSEDGLGDGKPGNGENCHGPGQVRSCNCPANWLGAESDKVFGRR